MHEKILAELSQIPNLKTKDIDTYSKGLIKSGTDVSEIKNYILTHQLLHRIYFQVSLGQITEITKQFSFIEDNEDIYKTGGMYQSEDIYELFQTICPTVGLCAFLNRTAKGSKEYKANIVTDKG